MAGLDILEKRNISCPCWGINPGSSNLQPQHYTDYAIPDPYMEGSCEYFK